MVSLNPEEKKKDTRKPDPSNPNATGTKFHPNNQVKADHPKKPSLFAPLLKEYRYEGGEITRWFVEAWDQFNTFAEAMKFMDEQISAKKYRAFCFSSDWPAIIDRFQYIKRKQAEATADAPFTTTVSGKILARTGSVEGSLSATVFTWTNEFVIAASPVLQPFVIKVAINHLNSLADKGIYNVSTANMETATNVTLPILHPECILEWVRAISLSIS
jgi:hypothetical protein